MRKLKTENRKLKLMIISVFCSPYFILILTPHITLFIAMKKHYFLFLLTAALFIAAPGYSQTEISGGTTYPLVEDGFEWVNYFEKGEELLAVKIIDKKMVLQKMNLKELTQTSVKTYTDFPKDRGLNFSEVKEIGGQYYVFYFLNDPSSQLDELHARAIDFSTGEFKDSGTKLLTLKTKLRDITYSISADGSKLLIRFSPQPTKPYNPKTYKMEFYVFDPYLKPLWSKDVDIPYTKVKMEIIQELIDSKGNVYQLRKVYDSPSSEDFQVDLIKIEATTAAISIASLTPGGTYSSPLLFEKISGSVACAGIYFTEAGRNGIFISDVHDDVHLVNTKKYEFSLALINQNLKPRAQRQNTERPAAASLDLLKLKQLITEEDGSLLLIGEQLYTEEDIIVNRTKYGSYMNNHNLNFSSDGIGVVTSVSKDNLYHFDDVVAMKISPSSEVSWMAKVPKRQVGRYPPGGMSYAFAQSEKSYAIYVVDNKRNDDLTTDEPAKFFNGPGMLTLHLVNKTTGKVQRIPIADTENVQGIPLRRFMLTRIIGIKDHNYSLIENYNGKRQDRLLKISWKE